MLLCLTIKLAVYLLSGNQYGYLSDELYFMQAGRRLDLGYLDFPPLIAWVAALIRGTLGESLYALRFVPFICGVLVTWLGVAITYTLGGGRVATFMSAIIIATAPIFVTFHGVFTLNALDQLWWAASLLLFTLYLRSPDPRLLPGLGTVIGIGLLTKLSITLLAVSMVVVLVARRPSVLRERSLYLGAALAGAIASPFVYWQVANDFPFFDFWSAYRAVEYESLVMDRFLLSQVLAMNPGQLVFWLPGIYELLRAADRRWRPLGWLVLSVFALCYLSGVRFYFFAPMYLLLAAGGAIFWERLLRRRGRAIRAGVLAFISINAIVVLPAGAPIIPIEWWREALASADRLLPPDGENRNLFSELFPHFAEMRGWQRLSNKVIAQYRRYERERDGLEIITSHFGEASAINHFNTDDGIPWACSGHMQYYYWCRDQELTSAIAVGYTVEELSRLFESVEVLDHDDCELCTRREQRALIALVRGPKLPRDELWEALKRFYIF